MKLVILALGMMLIQDSAHAFGSRRSSAPVPVPPSDPTIPVVVPANEDRGTGGVKVVIQSAVNYSSSGRALLESARELLERVVNSEEFKQRVIHFTYQGQETYVQNDGLTNLQIYNKIMNAQELHPNVTALNQQMDLYTELYTSNIFGRNVVGYTNESTPTIFMNTYFFNYAEPSGVAGNMMHEWLHKVGFDHDYKSTSRRPYSVPYAIGYIAEELVEKIQ